MITRQNWNREVTAELEAGAVTSLFVPESGTFLEFQFGFQCLLEDCGKVDVFAFCHRIEP